MREERTLVTSFESLKAGDLVDVKSCPWCGRTHRAVLTSKELVDDCVYASEPERRHRAVAWNYLPQPGCDGGRVSRIVLGENAVAERRVWLISTGLDEQQAQREGESLGVAAEVHRRMLARQRP